MMDTNARASEPSLRWLRRAPAGLSAGMKAPRLGVLSGTFNPPTRAHLELAQQAARQLGLGEVLFVIPEVPPHKERLQASLEDRAEMLVRAIAKGAQFSAAITSHGLFLDIHRALAPEYPAATRAVFLTGRDAAERILLHWPYEDPVKALEEMFARFDFAVADRGGDFEVPWDSRVARYRAQINSLRLAVDFEDVSATRVRGRVARGASVEDVVPTEVAAYIAERGLYR